MAARILIVEDDQGIQQLLEVNLTRAGHLVQCAENAEAAQEMVRAELPDIVLLDWRLPGISGIEMARWMKSDPRTRDVGLIMLTARAHERDVIAGFEAGADDYIIKPFSVRDNRVHCLPTAADELKATASEGLVWLEGQLGEWPYLTGGHLTVADLMLFSFLEFGALVGQGLDPALRRLSHWHERMAVRPSAAATAI